MNKFDISCSLKKALLSAFFILIAGCSSDTHSWASREIHSSSPSRCTQLYLSPANTFRNLEVVMIHEGESERLYLNVYGSPFKTDQDNTVTVVITIDGAINRYQVQPLEGNQRLRLPQEAELALVVAIKNHQAIEISAGRYSTEIHYEGFDSAQKTFFKEL